VGADRAKTSKFSVIDVVSTVLPVVSQVAVETIPPGLVLRVRSVSDTRAPAMTLRQQEPKGLPRGEQPRSETADHRSDRWSLSSTLRAGDWPFPSRLPLASSKRDGRTAALSMRSGVDVRADRHPTITGAATKAAAP